MASLVETVNHAVDRLGSLAALARALQVTASHLTRVRQGKAGIGPEASLLLSRVTGRDYLEGLREDSHGELADILEQLGAFGAKRRSRKGAPGAAVDSLTQADQAIVFALIKHLSGRRGSKR